MKRQSIGISIIFLIAAAVVLKGTVSPAWAAFTTYTDKGLWTSAVGIYITEDFNDLTLNSELSFSNTNPDPAYPAYGPSTGGVWLDQLKQTGATPPWTTTWTFSAPITAFGGNWDTSPFGPGTGIAVTTVAGGPVPVEVAYTSSGGFFGFTSTVAFTDVILSAGTQNFPAYIETYTLEDMVYSTPVPIPGAVWLLAGGFLGLIGVRRKLS